MIEITGSRGRGQNITGWRDGRTQLRVWWRGTDNPGPEAQWVEYMSVITSERQALITLGHIASFANLAVISAEPERLGRVIACPRCDKALQERHGGPWCPRCAVHPPGRAGARGQGQPRDPGPDGHGGPGSVRRAAARQGG